MPAGTVDSLLKPDNKNDLVNILTYHVLPGKVMSGEIAGKSLEVKMLNGSIAKVNAMSGVMVESANVTQADIEAKNGFIHVIDTVIISTK